MCLLRNVDEIFSRLQRDGEDIWGSTQHHPTKHDLRMSPGTPDDIWRRIPCTNLHNISNFRFLVNGNWLSPEPARRSVLLLHGYCNLRFEWFWMDLCYEEVPGQLLSHDWLLIHGGHSGHTNLASKEFSLVGTLFFLSGLLVLFLHEGCTLTSQFDKQFWASVMACLNKIFLFRKW
jgi:hypothetical protein